MVKGKAAQAPGSQRVAQHRRPLTIEQQIQLEVFCGLCGRRATSLITIRTPWKLGFRAHIRGSGLLNLFEACVRWLPSQRLFCPTAACLRLCIPRSSNPSVLSLGRRASGCGCGMESVVWINRRRAMRRAPHDPSRALRCGILLLAPWHGRL